MSVLRHLRWLSPRQALALVAIVLTGSLYFLAGKHATRPLAGGGDAQNYYILARTLVSEHAYREPWPEQRPFKAWRPPLHPWLLSHFLRATNGSLPGVITIQRMMLIVSGLLVIALHVLVFNSTWQAIGVALLFFSFGPFFFWASNLHSETLFTLLFYAFLVAAWLAFKRRSSALFGIAGILLGLATITRTITLPPLGLATACACLLAILGVVDRTRAFAVRCWERLGIMRPISAMVLLVCAWTVIGVVTVRNYRALGSLVLVNTSTGINAYDGTFDRFSEAWPTISRDSIAPLFAALGEVESNEALKQRALRRAVENPGLYVYLRAKSMYYYLMPNLDWEISRLPGFVHYGRIGRGIVTLLFAIGVIGIVRERRRGPLALLMIFLLVSGASSLAPFTERYGIPMIPIYFMTAVFGYAWLLRLISRRRIASE